jgi:hypothetical protein
VWKRSAIARNYVQRWFFVDLVSAIPWQFLFQDICRFTGKYVWSKYRVRSCCMHPCYMTNCDLPDASDSAQIVRSHATVDVVQPSQIVEAGQACQDGDNATCVKCAQESGEAFLSSFFAADKHITECTGNDSYDSLCIPLDLTPFNLEREQYVGDCAQSYRQTYGKKGTTKVCIGPLPLSQQLGELSDCAWSICGAIFLQALSSTCSCVAALEIQFRLLERRNCLLCLQCFRAHVLFIHHHCNESGHGHV